MNDEVKQQKAAEASASSAPLIAGILIVLGGIVGYYVLKSRPEAWMSWGSLAGGFALGILVFALSAQGRDFWQFVLESRVELRKVFWPTRAETMQTTMIVIVFVIIASLFFWVLDLSLASITRFFTGRES
jgi:preprotein translocase subunit SecE